MNELEGRPIRGTEGAPSTPFFSPDGRWIGYWDVQDEGLKKIDIDGVRPSCWTVPPSSEVRVGGSTEQFCTRRAMAFGESLQMAVDRLLLQNLENLVRYVEGIIGDIKKGVVAPVHFAGQVPAVSRSDVISSSRSLRSSPANTSIRGAGPPAVGPPGRPAPAVPPGVSVPVISTRLPTNCDALPSFAPVSL
jgi:hypothetical protein